MSKFNVSELARVGVTNANGAFKLLDANAKRIAMDETLSTTANGGLLPLFTSYVDPETIRVLFAPMPLAEKLPEVQKGDFTTTNAVFPVVETAGKPTSYGDWNDNSSTSTNAEFVERQPYLYQEIIHIGERELEMYGQARINLAQEMQEGCALSLNKLQHNIYVFGVSGLLNYGILNDPNLSAAITGANWATGTNLDMLNDVRKMFTQLVKQTNGLVRRNDALTLFLSPDQESNLTASNEYNTSAYDLIMKAFPNLEIVSVPEYATATGEYLQLVSPKYNGSNNIELGYNVKMRVHPLVQALSGYKQKRSQGSYGSIIKRPAFIATMINSSATGNGGAY